MQGKPTRAQQQGPDVLMCFNQYGVHVYLPVLCFKVSATAVRESHPDWQLGSLFYAQIPSLALQTSPVALVHPNLKIASEKQVFFILIH